MTQIRSKTCIMWTTKKIQLGALWVNSNANNDPIAISIDHVVRCPQLLISFIFSFSLISLLPPHYLSFFILKLRYLLHLIYR